MKISVAGMGGVAPRVTPELLPLSAAQAASNVVLHNGGVAPLKAPVTVATPTKAGTGLTIHRFGKNQPETQYWFKFTTIANVVRGTVAKDTEERTYFTGDGVPKKTKFDLATGSGTDYPVASYNLKVPAPVAAPVVTQTTGTGPVITEQRAYVTTFVTGWGEESAPSPAAIGTADATHVCLLSSMEAAPAGSYNITTRYIYRSVTTASGVGYYYVGQTPIATTTFTDSTSTLNIGEPLQSLDWDVPPDDLFGLIALPSGALCAISGKDVCFSVPNAPYAWPEKYRLTCDYNPVAVAPMGQGIIVLTDGFPYFINSSDPENTQMVRMDDEQSCVAARSVVAFAGGVLYASPDGLILITQSGAQVMTDKLYDRKAWQALGPSGIFAVKHDTRYYGFLPAGGFILDAAGNFTFHDINATAAFVDPVLDQLYVLVGSTVQKWDSGSAKTHTWKSKRFNSGGATSFGWGKVVANDYASLTFKLYADTVLVLTKTVTSAAPFRLPSGLARLWEVEISGTSHWLSAHLAQASGELSDV